MAIFTIAKYKDENGQTKQCKYIDEIDLINLIHYCHNKSIYVRWNQLYPLGIEAFIDQMLYLQKFRGKPISTRAVHYILSVNSYELPRKEKAKKMKDIIDYICCLFFSEYQCLYFLHHDKEYRYDIHIIINPIDVYSLNVYQCSEKRFLELLRDIATHLFMFFHMELENVTYIDEKGKMNFEEAFN